MFVRYYIFNPQNGKFRDWRGEWVDFKAAQDFTKLTLARASEALSRCPAGCLFFKLEQVTT